MLRKIQSLIFFLFISTATLHAQNFKPVVFSDFEKFLQTNNDTLYVINFWATWCKPCIEEMPVFEKLQAETGGQKIKVILISVDTESRWQSALAPFIERRNLQSEVWSFYNVKPIDWIDKISTEWDGAIPATLFLRNGTKTFFGIEFSDEELHTIVEQLKS